MLTGEAAARLEFAPRPEFGQVPIRLQPLGDGLLVLGSSESSALYAPGVEWDVFDDGGHDSARAVVDLSASGGRAVLELRFDSQSLNPHPDSIEERQSRAEQSWRDWAAGLQLPATATREVMRSALTLRALCHEPTGSILAAATTSLPEELGGIRNWDYRYCWLRDAAMTARVLVDLGSLEEAEALLRWVDGCIDRTGGHPERLHPLYTVEGLELGPEAVIDTLPGYAGSRPVRVGNAANRQIQLDVFGPIADLVAAVAQARGFVRDSDWHVVQEMVRAVERRWHEPDHGIWEARMAPRHHVYSKVMCWLTVARGIEVQELRGEPVPSEWVELRDRIRANVLLLGWNDAAGAYSVAYGDEDIDASSLWVGPLGARHRRRSALSRDGAEGGGGAEKRRCRLSLSLGRRAARARGWVPHLHGLARGGLPAHRQARRRGGALPADARDRGADGAPAGAVRPVRRAWPRQPPAGLQPPRADPLRAGSRGRLGRYVVRRLTTFRRKQHRCETPHY